MSCFIWLINTGLTVCLLLFIFQQQFNMFVLCMRQDYQEKRKAFRQIMDVHKVELEDKERYWNEMLKVRPEEQIRWVFDDN